MEWPGDLFERHDGSHNWTVPSITSTYKGQICFYGSTSIDLHVLFHSEKNLVPICKKKADSPTTVQSGLEMKLGN